MRVTTPLLLLVLTAVAARADHWPMYQRDMQHTGRADFSVPLSRLNSSFFDAVQWQNPLPGAAGASSPVFHDDVSGQNLVAVGYHWPKGIELMDRLTGQSRWAGNPAGGERIGDYTPAFSADGERLYVVNDATEPNLPPNGHPLMALNSLSGWTIQAHNGGMALPAATSMCSPTLAPDGRIFLHQWGGVAGAAQDNGTTLSLAWSAASPANCFFSDPALFEVEGALRVVTCGRDGWIRCFDGGSGAELWSRAVEYGTDASPTVDPLSGSIYVAISSSSVAVVGLSADGDPLWGSVAQPVFTHVSGLNQPQRAQSAGCLAHDGSVYYFQTVAEDGSGALYAVNTADGSLNWQIETGSQGWEEVCAAPIVTPNGVLIVGNNHGGRWYAIRDLGERALVIDELAGSAANYARSTPSLANDGRLYLTEYAVWRTGNPSNPYPDHSVRHLLSSRDLGEGDCHLVNPAAPQVELSGEDLRLSWPVTEDPDGCFGHYAIYRSSEHFFAAGGLTPVGEAGERLSPEYLDAPGQGVWHYAVAVVHADGTQDPLVECTGPNELGLPADRWAMQQRDQEHTGRAWFEIPASRQNDQLFETCRWQTPLPGGVGGSSPLFTPTDGETVGRVAVGYHWPKGVQVMNRATGVVDWALNPGGGETIGEFSGALSADNGWIYVTNDATESPEWPGGTPVMALDLLYGNVRAHSGGAADPGLVSRPALTLGDDGHVYAHGWGLGPASLTDTGGSLEMTWTPWSIGGHYHNGVALGWWQGDLRAVTGNEAGSVECWSTSGDSPLWSRETGMPLIATATVDPASGRIYLPAGTNHVGVVGLNPDGTPAWSAAYRQLFTWVDGANSPQRAQAGGALSHDGATFYFQSVAEDGSGALYAVNTGDGSLKWSLPTGSAGWERASSCPLVTPNGILILGNNTDRWLALRDDGAGCSVLDEWLCDSDAATSSPALGEDGLLYLSTRREWSAPNALVMPDHEIHDLLAAVDLGASPWTVTPACVAANPQQVTAVALNESVRLNWTPVNVPTECFDRYRIYREPGPFDSISGLEHVAEVEGVDSDTFLDEGLGNDQPLWYAVVGVNLDGSFDPAVTATGPRTPHWRSDLQVACIRRSPQFQRYLPMYTGLEISEPDGFGPYLFSAASGLEAGQSCADPHQPNLGDPVTWTAVVRNAGTTSWEGELPWAWWVDENLQAEGQRFLNLAPGDTALFSHTRVWDGDGHRLQFSLYSWDDNSSNNELDQEAWSVPFKTYLDVTQLEQFRELSGTWPSPWTRDHIDWLQRHMARFNQLFEEAGVAKRVHYDLLQVLDDTADDPALPPDSHFGIFPFRYRAGEGDPRLSGYYNPDEDIDYGLLHELAHQLGLIDVYQLDVPAEANLVSGLAYTAHEDLMHGCSPLLNQHSAAAMRHWDRQGHGYYGQYLYGLPAILRMRFLDYTGAPLAGAQVEVFQYCERPGMGKVITDQLKFSGSTDGDGFFTLPNVDIDEGLVPGTCLGDRLTDNPFGYVAVVASNGVLHFRVTAQESVDYAWLDISEANVAFYDGQQEEAVFERQLQLGGEPEYYLAADNCESNADQWAVVSNGDHALSDDGTERVLGATSLKADTQGDFLTLIYPGHRQGRYDLSGCDSLVFWSRVDNDWPFQLNAPQIRLYCASEAYVEFLPDQDLLTPAGGAWTRISLPLAGGDGWTRTESGSPDLTLVNRIEFFADTWDWAFSWWLDGLQFLPACCATDCNGNGLRDCDDLASGFSQDANGNHVPDECECGGGISAPGLAITLEGAQLRLGWSAVTHDLSGCPLADPLYHIWQAPAATGPWSETESTDGLSSLRPVEGSRGFFRVSVTDGTASRRLSRVDMESATSGSPLPSLD
ncbi:MAG: PQQ-binding-like beta-propeller repeat protein [Candidatus Delongbacteria bacterium]